MLKVRKAKKEELKKLIPIYRETFIVHNIFDKKDNEVIKHMKNMDTDWFIALDKDKIIGAIARTCKIKIKKWGSYKLNHFAVAKAYRGKGAGPLLLKKAEEGIKGKIEISVSENERASLGFYKRYGYKIEGRLASHYRPGEVCFVLGKVKK